MTGTRWWSGLGEKLSVSRYSTVSRRTEALTASCVRFVSTSHIPIARERVAIGHTADLKCTHGKLALCTIRHLIETTSFKTRKATGKTEFPLFIRKRPVEYK